jgi:type IV secretory pathway VirB2 component (pilin)
MCNALAVVTGSAGKTFAAFAIISVGVGFFTGKVSWGLMIGVAAGIAAMFGAPSIVAAISGQDTNMKCDLNLNK